MHKSLANLFFHDFSGILLTCVVTGSANMCEVELLASSKSSRFFPIIDQKGLH